MLPSLAVPLALVAFEGVANADYGINGTSCAYASLQDAVDDAGPGGTVYVESGSNNIGSAVEITQDVTLRGTNANCSAAATGNATLSFNGVNDRILTIDAGAFVTLDTMTLTGGSTPNNGGLVYLESGSTLNAVDSTFTDGTAQINGGCIAAVQSDVWLDNSTVDQCVANQDGGAIWVDLGYVFVTANSTIRNGVAPSGDGGNIAADASIVSFYGRMYNGFAAGNGGGIAGRKATGTESEILVDLGAEVFSNDANWGGGLYIAGLGSLLTVRGTVRDNDADAGGGILAELSAAVVVESDAVVSGNEAGLGGGIRLGYATLELADDAAIIENIATKVGGGINAYGSDITAEGNVRIEDNEAQCEDNLTQGGGGVRMEDSTLVGVGLVFTENSAGAGRGGAILATAGSEIELTNSTIDFGIAGHGGGIYASSSSIVLDADFGLCDPSTLDIDRYCSQVYFNLAADEDGGVGRGGGISLTGASSLDAEQTMIGYNIAPNGGQQLSVQNALASATILNGAIISDPTLSGLVPGSAVLLTAGALDLRSSTVAGHDVGLDFAAGSTGVMHRNIVAENSTGAILGGVVTGGCNLSQNAAEAPTGSNNQVGDPGFVPGSRSTYEIDATSTRAVDKCTAGPNADIDGNPRPVTARWDRGMFEVQ